MPSRSTAHSRPERPSVLVIPGIDGSTELLQSVGPRLFPDLRSSYFDHRTDRAEGGLEGLAERALASLDAEHGASDEPIYVCGESFGGPVALTLAHRYPERVRGLILLSTFGWYPTFRSYCGEVGLRLWERVGDRAAGYLMACGRPANVFGSLGFRFSRDAMRAYIKQTPVDMVAYRKKCELAVRFDARPWLHEISQPTLVVTGNWDSVVPIEAGRELAERIPNARLRQVSGGHLVYITRPDEVGGHIATWVAETASPTPPVLTAR